MNPFRVGKLFFLGLALFFVADSARGQSYVRDLRSIPFYHDSVAYTEPLSGGLNAPMQQFFDLDDDGDVDLFIFDNDFYPQTLFFRNTGSRDSALWELEPGGGFGGARFLFWFRLTDYDSDGETELLTDDSSSGIRVWKNGGSPTDPSWQLSVNRLIDTAALPLFAGFASLPGFADIDGDSLIDVLSGNSADGSFNYYRNAGSAGNPSYALVSNRYNDITIIGDICQQEPAAPTAEAARHGAGAVCLTDIDGNGTTDLFYGDIFSHSLFSLLNIGTPTAPQFECSADFYPPDSSLSTPGFNQGTFTDIDGDGDADMFVGVLNSRTTHSFWYYENMGSAIGPDFHLRSTDYIATLDVGQNAHPALVDLDGDGDADLVIGNNAGALWLFRNIGSELAPAYSLEDTLYGGITGNFSYSPAFADIDGDTDPDLILGRFDGRVIIYRNDGPAGYTPLDTILSGQYASPAVGDVDNDGDPDLIIGTGFGTLEFYLNTGDSLNHHFEAAVDSSLELNFGSSARPLLRRNGTTGLVDLFVAPASAPGGGAGQSRIYYFMNAGGGDAPRFVLMDDHFGPDVPYEAALALADIDGDGDDDLLVGTSKGGLVYYRNDDPTGVDVVPAAPRSFGLTQNYPNPFNGSTMISYRLSATANVRLDIYDLRGGFVGRLVSAREAPGLHHVRWTPDTMPTGPYYARLAVDDKMQVIRMIFIK